VTFKTIQLNMLTPTKMAVEERPIAVLIKIIQTSTLAHFGIGIPRMGYNAASTALATSAVPLLPPNSIGLMPSA
jgi:hypothetical protein